MSSLNQQLDSHKVHSGWLYKKGWYNTSWKKRYFVLYDDRTIHYFAKESHSINRTKAKGKIHLTQIRRVELVCYNDPKNKTKHGQSPTSLPIKLYRKTSLPLTLSGPYHTTPPTPPINHTQSKKHSKHIRKSKSQSNLPLSPNILSTFSFKDISQEPNINLTSPIIRSSTPTDIYKSFNYKPQKKERATSVHYVPKGPQLSPPSSNNVSPLQSINEKESVQAVTSLQPFMIQNDYFSAALTPRLSPHAETNNIAVNGVNGWSFNGMNMSDMNDINSAVSNYYSTPSNIVSSTQPPPDYNDIIKHEKKFEAQRQELDKSLQALTQKNKDNKNGIKHKKRKAHKNINKENKPQKQPRPPVPITRRQTRNRAQSCASAQITRDLSKMNHNNNNNKANSDILTLNLNGNNININRRTRSASCVYLRQQPLTLQSSSTTTFESTNNILKRGRSESNVSNVSVSVSGTGTNTSENTMQASDRSLTPYHSLIDLNNSVETVECELSDNEDMLSRSNSRDRIHSSELTSEINSSFNCSFSSNVSSDYMAGFGYGISKNKKDVILSTEIRRSHQNSLSMTGETDCNGVNGYSPYEISESKKDEFDIFETVMNDTRLGLSCNRRYSFSLIHPNREYILSAETNDELKEWISIFSKLVQGKPIYSGYLALKHMKKNAIYNKKFFILFENKVLNYYKDSNDVNNGNACEFDIDLRHVMWLRYCSKNEFNDINLKQVFGKENDNGNNNNNNNNINNSCYVSCQTAYFNTPSGNSVINPMAIKHKKKKKKKKKKKDSNNIYSLEIAIPNRIFIMTAETQRIRNEWYNKIRSVFPDTLILKRYFDSPVLNIYFGHNQSNFKNRYIALFQDMLVVFQDKKKLNTIKRMTFFDETRFRDYIRKNHCTIIPINNDVKVRRTKKNTHGNFAFVVSNHYDDRKWYFNCTKKEDLDQWIYLLVDKRKKQRKKSLSKSRSNNNNNGNNNNNNKNTNINLMPPPRYMSKKRKKKSKNKNKSKSCDMEVESTLSTPETDIRSTIINKRMELRDNTSNPSTIDEIIPDIDNYDLSLVSNKESPIPKDMSSPIDISNIMPNNINNVITARYNHYKHINNINNMNTNVYSNNNNYIIPSKNVNNKNKSVHFQSNYNYNYNKRDRDRVTEKLTRSYSDDLSDDNRYIIHTHTNTNKYIQKKQRSISVDTHDLSPQNKSKVNINLSQMFGK